jgi:hypothetical protein
VRLQLQLEVFAELRGGIEDFAFEELQMLEGDVEEIAGAARGVERLAREVIDELRRLE